MTNRVPLRDETVEQLSEHKSRGDTLDDAVQNLLEQAGGSGGSPPPDDELPEEQLAEANELAFSVMSGSEVNKGMREQLSARETLKRTQGVDPAEYDSEEELREAVEEAKAARGEK